MGLNVYLQKQCYLWRQFTRSCFPGINMLKRSRYKHFLLLSENVFLAQELKNNKVIWQTLERNFIFFNLRSKLGDEPL